VYRLESRGDRITAARFFGPDSIPGEIRASVFVLACGAIETARLLLNSRSVRFPTGLANSSGQVGKNLTFTVPSEVTGYFPKDSFPPDHLRDSPFVQCAIQDFHNLPPSAPHYPRGGTVVFLLPHPNPIRRAILHSYDDAGRRVWGTKLKERLRDFFDYYHIQSDTFIEFLPNPGTHVTLSRSVRDSRGIPAAAVSIRHHPENRWASQRLAVEIARIYRAMGAVRAVYRPSLYTAGELQHGTCRFGTDPRTCVLNPHCRSHDIRNLYVTDGSFMPSGIPVTSTLTIMANALRIAGHIHGAG
jgi:choline dehydrogenase-like flavoprotein